MSITISKRIFLCLSFLFLISCSQNDVTIINPDDEVLKLMLSSELEQNALFIYDISNVAINYELKDGWETAWERKALQNSNIDDTIHELCIGTGLAFAKCVRRKIDNSLCVTIYKDGREYIAIQTVCLDTNEITTTD